WELVRADCADQPQERKHEADRHRRAPSRTHPTDDEPGGDEELQREEGDQQCQDCQLTAAKQQGDPVDPQPMDEGWYPQQRRPPLLDWGSHTTSLGGIYIVVGPGQRTSPIACE